MPGTQRIESDRQSTLTKARRFGQKPPLKPKEVWSIRVRLQITGKVRDLALFNLAIDSKLRSCDLVTLRVGDISQAGRVRDRATITQQKTGRPVQFELSEQTREAVGAWIAEQSLSDESYLFQAECDKARTCRHVSMSGLCTSGWKASALIRTDMEHIRCAEPRRH
jgi:integrase